MKKFVLNFFFYTLTLTLCEGSIPRSGKDYRKLAGRTNSEFVPTENKGMTINGEPSCEELRAMWRFSRRQSRAAEITNEIPTYRDPFAYNMWEQYPRARSVMGSRFNGRTWSRPVYGRIVQNAPSHHPRVQNQESSKAYYEDVLSRSWDDSKSDFESRRRLQNPTFRLSGGNLSPNNRLGSSGSSFQHLKELIWAERAKELQQQRLLEEAAARTAALKDVQVPNHYNNNKSPSEQGQNNNNNFQYNLEQNLDRNSRIKYFNGEYDQNYNQDSYYRKPYRQRSMYSTETSNDRIW